MTRYLISDDDENVDDECLDRDSKMVDPNRAGPSTTPKELAGTLPRLVPTTSEDEVPDGDVVETPAPLPRSLPRLISTSSDDDN